MDQNGVVTYASDVVHAALRMAKQQAYNSYTWRDIHHFLTQEWRHCYERMIQIEPGYYSKTVQLTSRLTKLPPYVFNTLLVYRSTDPIGYNRQVYVEAGRKNYTSASTYHISGNDLYCYDAVYNTIWLNYVPAPDLIFFPAHNRDPWIIDQPRNTPSVDINDTPGKTNSYGMYWISKEANEDGHQHYFATHKGDPQIKIDVTPALYKGDWGLNAFNTPINPVKMYTIEAVILSYPYVFVTYRNNASGVYHSYILKNLLGEVQRYAYNAFDFTGDGTNVRFVRAKHNDDTGMGVVVADYNDDDDTHLKELGWVIDTCMCYPSTHTIVYDWMVANLAYRFALRNETELPEIAEMLTRTEREMSLFLRKDKSGFGRINNVTGPRISDVL